MLYALGSKDAEFGRLYNVFCLPLWRDKSCSMFYVLCSINNYSLFTIHYSLLILNSPFSILN
jgi:hypothetical protein